MIYKEKDLEIDALERLKQNNWKIKSGTDAAPGGLETERNEYAQIVLEQRLKDSLSSINPSLPDSVIDEAVQKITNPIGPNLYMRNRSFHKMLIDGIVITARYGSATKDEIVYLIDFDNSNNNNFLAVNQFTVKELENENRADIILFVNGLPLGIIELKSPTNVQAGMGGAYAQITNYKKSTPSLFESNEMIILSDGLQALLGTITSGLEKFSMWGDMENDKFKNNLFSMIDSVCKPENFLEMIRDFILFEDDAGHLTKTIARYNQVHAVKSAIKETIRATGMSTKKRSENADKRIGVVWHTQGSGKSITMVFYVSRVVRESVMKNPTIVMLTDRNDLDGQLFGTFSRCAQILRQKAVQTESRSDLKNKLATNGGGIVFTTIQKFLDEQDTALSERSNIVVMADEAHRSQYNFIKGYASSMRAALPNASFIGLTGTPIDRDDRNTKNVFGEYISIYDYERSQKDDVTVKINYENRAAKLKLDESNRIKITKEIDRIRREDDQEISPDLEHIMGLQKRLALLAKDIVEHFEAKSDGFEGKAMIVCMSRNVCVNLYGEIIKLKSKWHNTDDNKGKIKIIMTGSSSDPPEWQLHTRDKSQRTLLAKRFRNPDDEFQLVIVQSMWLTGFDAPSLHTLYMDRPMNGHGLMQAIARTNRKFKDKPAGLIVDYVGIYSNLLDVFAAYRKNDGRKYVINKKEEVIEKMIEKYDICKDMFYKFDWSAWDSDHNRKNLFTLLCDAKEHILAQRDGKARYANNVRNLSLAYSMAVPCDEAVGIRKHVEFFQTVQKWINKENMKKKLKAVDDSVIRDLTSKAVAIVGIVDIFEASGLTRPEGSVLSEQFLEQVRLMPRKNDAENLLEKLLKNEIRKHRTRNIVRAEDFLNQLNKLIIKYNNRSIETAHIINCMIELARDICKDDERIKELGLNEKEIAFYDSLKTNESAVKIMSENTFKIIAQELVEIIHNKTTTDWTIMETVRANLRFEIKKLLKKHGYPPDGRESAAKMIIEQAEIVMSHS